MAVTGLVIVVVVVGLVVGVSLFAFDAPDPDGGHTGNIVPDTDLLDLNLQVPSDWEFELSNGTTISLSDLSGKVILVDLMATWCTTCTIQNGYLESIYDTMAGPLFVLSLTIDRSETIAMMEDYQNDRGLPWAHGLDTGAKFANYFSVTSVPSLVLIDGDGYFRYLHEGLWSVASITDKVTSL
jgi:thiol-disulfide isomerase/thioredoxin